MEPPTYVFKKPIYRKITVEVLAEDKYCGVDCPGRDLRDVPEFIVPVEACKLFRTKRGKPRILREDRCGYLRVTECRKGEIK